jgi:two-component system, NarL family, response regulator DesR
MIRVIVADDQHLIRAAVVALLRLEPDLDVVAEAARGDDVLDLVREHAAEVAVLDLDMPGIGGIEVTRVLTTHYPSCASLILTSFMLPGNLTKAIAAGAKGFLGKDARAVQLIEAIRVVSRGGRAIDSSLAADALMGERSPLTVRETQVLRLVATGAEVMQIARNLLLSTGTVRNYISAAMSKLEARNRLDAVRICTEHGWL